MKRFHDNNENQSGAKRYSSPNYGSDHGSINQQSGGSFSVNKKSGSFSSINQQNTSFSSCSSLSTSSSPLSTSATPSSISSPPLSSTQDSYAQYSHFLNSGTQLVKDQLQHQMKYPNSVGMYSPSGIEQTTRSNVASTMYYNSYYSNPNWRFPNASGVPLPKLLVKYDPTQPPPPLPNLNNLGSQALGETPTPSYYCSTPPPPITVKTPLSSLNSTITEQENLHQKSFTSQAIDYALNMISGSVPPPIPIRGRGSLNRGMFRGGIHKRPGNMGMTNQSGMLGINHNLTKRNPFNNPIKKNKMNFKSHQNGQRRQNDSKENDEDDALSHIQVNKKAKRKPMSTRYPRKIEWDRGDALKALALEKEYNKLQRNSMLILKFPDPELNKNIVKEYSPYIESVHFQQPSTPRYCFVQLKEGADIDKIRDELNQIPFGVGKIIAERKRMHSEDEDSITPEDIDPYTLYIGNLPTTITVKTVKEHFPNSRRIDIGYAQRMRYTRYAFIRYETVEDAMDAYRKTFNLLIESRSLIVRFRRQKGNVGLPGESRPTMPKKDSQIRGQQTNKQDHNNDLRTESLEDGIIDVDSSTKVLPILKDDTSTENLHEHEEKKSIDNEDESNKFDLDSKEHVLEEIQKLMSQDKHNQYSWDNTTVKQENCVEDKEMSEREYWWGTSIKDEPLDDDELLRRADAYVEDYSDTEEEPEEVDDDLNYADNDDVDEKPDIKIFSNPLPPPSANVTKTQSTTSLSSTFSLPITSTAGSIFSTERFGDSNQNYTNGDNNTKNMSANKDTFYGSEIDEIFKRINSEDADDFTF